MLSLKEFRKLCTEQLNDTEMGNFVGGREVHTTPAENNYHPNQYSDIKYYGDTMLDGGGVCDCDYLGGNYTLN